VVNCEFLGIGMLKIFEGEWRKSVHVLIKSLLYFTSIDVSVVFWQFI